MVRSASSRVSNHEATVEPANIPLKLFAPPDKFADVNANATVRLL